jgi:DNA modification methylase
MNTTHRIYFKNSNEMSELSPDSVDLIITSPPYPMIEMWDSLFSESNYEIKNALEEEDGRKAFLLMHYELNKVWKECVRVLKEGGLICINIGDATRKINNNFQLFPNHVLITNFFQEHGFISLPYILWRKPTNAPNKFMGSGMLPPNAYVTHEHEYILLFRKGEKKAKIPPKLEQRYNSAYFWEERNNWFSDIWSDLRGTAQTLMNGTPKSGDTEDEIRERSAAFPIDLPYRLINMYSIYGETVLDPFWGTGTTTLAAMVCARNSIGYDLNSEFGRIFESRIKEVKILSKKVNIERLEAHISFINQKTKLGKEIKHENIHYGFKVNTIQEKELLLYTINNIKLKNNMYLVNHEPYYLE